MTDIDPKMKDVTIWEYAKLNGLVILTKDADFYHRSMLDENGPAVVYFKLGNMTLSELHTYFSSFWHFILKHLPDARIITAYQDHVEVIR